jgi:hydrogenase/urease accessory protein HupE
VFKPARDAGKNNLGYSMSLARKIFSCIITALFLSIAATVSAHELTMGGSRWCFGKNSITANIDLGQSLLAQIPGIKEGQYNVAASSADQLQQIATDIIQPYISRKLSITVNDETYPVKVIKLVRNENNLCTIWLSVDNINFKNPKNPVKIDYRLLFDETNNSHLNIAYIYFADAPEDAVQKVFDFSQPSGQNTFDHNASVWEVSVKGAVPGPAPEPKTESHVVDVKSGSIQDNAGDNSTAGAPQSGIIAKTVKTGAKTGSRPNAIPAERKTDKNFSVSSKHPSGDSNTANMPAKRPLWANIGEFIVLGIEHILTGYDHMAFLLALIVIGLSIREVLKIITAFTIAHSITLLLAAMQVVSLNSRVVESVIAFSICFVALENLFKKKVNYRWLVTFGFGLIHGFGFASVLQELIVGKSNLLVSVVSFNLGVELGQLMIFLVLLPVLHLLKKMIEFRKVTIGVSLAIFMLGFTWLIERVFNLQLISS